MGRNKSNNYFDEFINLVDYSCKAATLLNNFVNNFDINELGSKMKEMHDIEHSADTARHEMIKKLAREFITPIEREDIMAMADYIDNVTDKIEDVLMRIYIFNIQEMRPDAVRMTEIIVKCCDTLKLALTEFHNFRKSDSLHTLIVEINQYEEAGDSLFMSGTRDLYANCKNPIEVIAWDQLYHYLEICCDSCEDVADTIENIIMKNS